MAAFGDPDLKPAIKQLIEAEFERVGFNAGYVSSWDLLLNWVRDGGGLYSRTPTTIPPGPDGSFSDFQALFPLDLTNPHLGMLMLIRQ